MPDDSSRRREILRRAEAAFDDPYAQARLAEEGIHLGEEEKLSPRDLLNLLADDEVGDLPSVTVTVYFGDTPIRDRSEIEEPLSSSLEAAGLGGWTGSGQGRIGDDSFFDVTFTVQDLEDALPFLRRKLVELGAGPRTELSTSDGRTLGLRDGS